MKTLISSILLFLLFLVNVSNAQVLKAAVTIDFGYLPAEEVNNLQDLATNIQDFINNFAWTDDEYDTARNKAQATGNNSFVETIDWAWNEKTVDPVTRMIGVWKAITEGIEAALK